MVNPPQKNGENVLLDNAESGIRDSNHLGHPATLGRQRPTVLTL